MSLPAAPPPEWIDKVAAGIVDRLSWASMHWGTEDVHSDAWPHVAAAALAAIWPNVLALAATQHDDQEQP